MAVRVTQLFSVARVMCNMQTQVAQRQSAPAEGRFEMWWEIPPYFHVTIITSVTLKL